MGRTALTQAHNEASPRHSSYSGLSRASRCSPPSRPAPHRQAGQRPAQSAAASRARHQSVSSSSDTLACKSRHTSTETLIVSQLAAQLINTRANTGRLTCLLMGLLRALRRLLLHELLPLILLWMLMLLLKFLQLVAAVCGSCDLRGKTQNAWEFGP